MQKLSWSLTKALRSDMLKNLLQLDMTFYHNNPVGELVECVEGDVLILSNNISTFVLDIISNIIILLGILIIVFFNSVLLGCVFVLCSVFALCSVCAVFVFCSVCASATSAVFPEANVSGTLISFCAACPRSDGSFFFRSFGGHSKSVPDAETESASGFICIG